jgi:hypothetical protein
MAVRGRYVERAGERVCALFNQSVQSMRSDMTRCEPFLQHCGWSRRRQHYRLCRKSQPMPAHSGSTAADQEGLWGFVAPLLTSAADLEALGRFTNDDPIERAIWLAALQAEADERGVTLVRLALQCEPEATGAY